MINVIEHLAHYLRMDVDALAVVSQNVANQSTVGYRASRLLPDFSRLAGTPTRQVSLNPGPTIETGQPFDFALEGAGFFTVGDADGMLLTRAGQFHRRDDGYLVDALSREVLGQSGPIAIGVEPISVNSQGEIIQQGQAIDRLLILTPGEGSGAEPVAGGLRPIGPAVEANPRVRQGVLEGANVDTAQETIALIELTRHVESVQRALSIYDKAIELGINRLGENQ